MKCLVFTSSSFSILLRHEYESAGLFEKKEGGSAQAVCGSWDSNFPVTVWTECPSWKVEKYGLPYSGASAATGPYTLPLVLCNSGFFPIMWLVLENLYESLTAGCNLFCSPMWLLWFCGVCHTISLTKMEMQCQCFPQVVICIDCWNYWRLDTDFFFFFKLVKKKEAILFQRKNHHIVHFQTMLICVASLVQTILFYLIGHQRAYSTLYELNPDYF